MSEDRLARIRLMLGEEKLERLKKSFVVVVGMGAVGSYAVEGLARSGVGRLRLVDFDVIRASNINRQLYALGSTLGRHKAEAAAARRWAACPRSPASSASPSPTPPLNCSPEKSPGEARRPPA